MSGPSAVFVGRADYNGLGQGWSEVYYLSGNTVSAAKAALLAIVDARHNMLHADLACVYANVVQIGVKRKSFYVRPTEVKGQLTDATMKVNRLQDCLWLRQETAAGDSANRYIHGVPDKCCIEGDYLADTGAGSYDGLVTALKAVLLTNTGYLKRDVTAGVTSFSIIAYTSIEIRGLTGHKVGKPFDQQRGRRSVG